MKNLVHKVASVFGSKNDRILAPYRRRVPAINALEKTLEGLSDEDLRRRFGELKTRRQQGAAAAELLNETFAVVREAAKRTLEMRHFDEQLLGGMVLFDGNIAEMKTGEGKTLAATLPVCLEALSGNGVHVVTVNDYLARRDARWMGDLYNFLGLTVGVNLAGMSVEEKAAAYQSDITYGTNNEFGFDYLRHNMRYSAAQAVQRKLNFAIVDEVDSILIDEARTPLIISGEANDNIDVYYAVAKVARGFSPGAVGEDGGDGGDFTLDEKARSVHLTEVGFEKAERLFVDAGLLAAGESIYAANNLSLLHQLDVALRAIYLFIKDRDYVVQNGEVVIVDEFTGRLMPGRRWGDNQHQAVEAKEGLKVQKENQTLASISFQNYFRLYGKIAGMTGTAATEAEEFEFIYGLRTVAIPTHRQMIRGDELDKVYRTEKGKYRAVIADISAAHDKQQPVLIGTTSIEESERLSALLNDNKLPHNVLNAKQHEKEAAIIAQAGAPGAITIATNMAGRGTDIVLGGNIEAEQTRLKNDEALSAAERDAKITEFESAWRQGHDQVLDAGGLRIIGTTRHESRRIDNQLRGRSGRQGDPGSSIFYLSFEDALLRIFATRHVSALMEKLNLDEDEAIEAKMVSRTIENAQRKVESHNFDIRKQLLDYDDAANAQRHLIYQQREEILTTDDIAGVAAHIREEHLDALLEEYMPAEMPEEEWRCRELETLLAAEYRLTIPIQQWVKENDKEQRGYFVNRLKEAAEAQFNEKFAAIGDDSKSHFMRMLILNIIDDHWRSHLAALDSLRLSIGFRGMAQKNPRQEYKREAHGMFNQLLENIRLSVTKVFYSLQIKKQDEDAAAAPPPAAQNLQYRHAAPPPAAGGESAPPPAAPPAAAAAPAPPAPDAAAKVATVRRQQKKIRRNEPCPCGSGKKYKHCHGKI